MARILIVGLIATVSMMLASGCAESLEPSPLGDYPTAADGSEATEAQALITEGTPQAIGLLALLNDPETTFERLDRPARLNRRSARMLIHHRDGGMF